MGGRAPSSSAVGARIEAPRGGVWRGVPSPLGEGPGKETVPLPEKKFDFRSEIGEFWCKLGDFCTVHLKLV